MAILVAVLVVAMLVAFNIELRKQNRLQEIRDDLNIVAHKRVMLALTGCHQSPFYEGTYTMLEKEYNRLQQELVIERVRIL